jgi:type I restriction enzyme M protein
LNHSEIVSFLWGVADLIRDTFKRGKYQDVILPLTVLRRLDCVLAPTKEKVLATQAKFEGKLENPHDQLCKASGFAFYNTSRYDFEKLLADAPHVPANLRNYIAGFSPNMREVLEKFDFDNTISKLDEAGLLFQVLEPDGGPRPRQRAGPALPGPALGRQRQELHHRLAGAPALGAARRR